MANESIDVDVTSPGWNFVTAVVTTTEEVVGFGDGTLTAIDMALWDFAAKKAGVPLYKLLGGASRTGLLSYAHTSGTSLETLNEAIHGYVEQGFQAVDPVRHTGSRPDLRRPRPCSRREVRV